MTHNNLFMTQNPKKLGLGTWFGTWVSRLENDLIFPLEEVSKITHPSAPKLTVITATWKMCSSNENCWTNVWCGQGTFWTTDSFTATRRAFGSFSHIHHGNGGCTNVVLASTNKQTNKQVKLAQTNRTAVRTRTNEAKEVFRDCHSNRTSQWV